MKKKLNVIAATTLCIALSACGSSGSSTPEPSSIANTSDVVSSITPIDDFRYDISGDTISLQKYSGSDDIVYIDNQYSIDGTAYNVVSIDGAMFFSGNVKTVILADGIQEINHALFNGAKIERLYIPSTINCIYDDSLAYISRSLTDIYYGGSEDEWNQAYTPYDAGGVSENIENNNFEGAGAAAANKLNSLIGHSDFDISAVSLHYNSSETDLLGE